MGPGSCGTTSFTHDQRVFITIQLMERAHRAIKSVNQNAIVFMPPPGPQNDDLQLTGAPGSDDTSLQTVARFIQDIYKDIASWNGNPRYYFDGVSYHTYIYQDATEQSWVAPNQAIYAVLTANGDGQVPIIISEVGNTEGLLNNPQTLANWMQDTIRLPSRPGEFHPESLSRVESRRDPGFE